MSAIFFIFIFILFFRLKSVYNISSSSILIGRGSFERIKASPPVNMSHMFARYLSFSGPLIKGSLGHPGSLMSTHVLKCMCMQTAPLLNVPRGRRVDTSFSITQIQNCTMPGSEIEPGSLLWEASALSTELHPLISLLKHQNKIINCIILWRYLIWVVQVSKCS